MHEVSLETSFGIVRFCYLFVYIGRDKWLQAISKMYLTPNYGVASLFKMLTYSHVCCAFSSARALSLNVICIFEMACKQGVVYYGLVFRQGVITPHNKADRYRRSNQRRRAGCRDRHQKKRRDRRSCRGCRTNAGQHSSLHRKAAQKAISV